MLLGIILRFNFTMNRKLIVRIICILLALIMGLSLITGALSVVAHADDLDDELDELNQEREDAKKNVASAQNKVEQLKQEQALVIEEKVALEERNDAAQQEISVIEKQIALVSKEIDTFEIKIANKEKEVEAAQAKEDEQLEKYRARIRAMEENGGYNILSFILNASSLSELLSAFDDYQDVMQSDVLLYDQLQEARSAHEKVKAEYVAYKAECEEIKAEFEENLAVLEEEKAELEKQIEESEQLIEEYAEKIKKAEEEQRRMEAIEAAAAAAAANFLTEYYRAKAEQQSAQASGGSGSVEGISGGGSEGSVEGITGGDSGGSSSSGGNASGITIYADGQGTGSYQWPFPGHYTISSPFGYRSSTGSYHTGIDIDGYQSKGSPIIAADSGVVIKAAYSGGYGNCIIIDHGNGYSTLYAHLDSMYVGAGASVGKGQTIGAVGNTGTCYGLDGVHLHFEVLMNGVQVDPQGYL